MFGSKVVKRMSSYILVGNNYPEKKWWNEIVRACAVVGDPFEIHCSRRSADGIRRSRGAAVALRADVRY